MMPHETQSGHTPGPWVVKEQHAGTGRGGKKTGPVIGLVIMQTGGPGRGARIGWPSHCSAMHGSTPDHAGPTNWTNARLMAAAPDLLAALQRIVKDWDGEPEDMQEAEEAIRKATLPAPPEATHAR